MSSVTFGRRGVAPGGPRGAGPPPAAPEPKPASTSSSILSQVFSLEGRAPRLHYWVGQGVFLVLCRLIVFASHALRAQTHAGSDTPGALLMMLAGLLAILAVLAAAFWASVCLVVRRWHDRGRSGFWALLGFIPIIGWAWQGIECGFLEGTLGPNPFGPSPKGITGVTYDDGVRSPA